MQPEVDVTMFLVSPPTEIGSTKGPALLLYLLNILAKAIISQFISEASVSPKSADPVGIMGSTMFAQEDFRWNGFSLVDILIAKFHVVCPVLFGIYGDEATSEGKRRLGWTREEKTGHWVSGQRHFERMTGLGAGYAAIALRNFDNSRHENPFPPYHFWTTLASITNVPAAEVTSTHFAVLKAMIENNEQRILQFFGDGGIMALRAALIEFPRRVGFNSSAAKAVAILTDVLRKDKKIFL
jgi:nucleoporin GLE1